MSVGSVMASGDKNSLLVQVFDSLIEKGHAQPTTHRRGPHIRARNTTQAFWLNCLGMLAFSVAVLVLSLTL